MAVAVRFHREDPVGAAPARRGRDAEHTAQLHHDRHALHLLGAVRRGADAALVPLRRPQRDPPLPVRRPDERPGPPEGGRADGARGGRRGGRDRPDLLGQRCAHARVLRRARGGARRLRGHGPPLPEGSGRAPHRRGGQGARAALPRRGRRAPDRAAQPLHDRARAVRLPRGCSRRLPRAAHGGRPARARHVEPLGEHDPPRPRGGGLLALARPGRARGDDGLLRRARPRARPARGRAAGVRRDLLPPPARRRDGLDDEADARRAAAARALRRRARGGRPGPCRDGLPDHRHARLAARGDAVAKERGRRRALAERPGRDHPLLPRTLRRAGGAVVRRRSPTECCRGRAPRRFATSSPISVEDARRQFGTRISDEELLLRATMPEEQVDAIGRGAAGPKPGRRFSSARWRSATRSRTCGSVPATARSSGADET